MAIITFTIKFSIHNVIVNEVVLPYVTFPLAEPKDTTYTFNGAVSTIKDNKFFHR